MKRKRKDDTYGTQEAPRFCSTRKRQQGNTLHVHLPHVHRQAISGYSHRDRYDSTPTDLAAETTLKKLTNACSLRRGGHPLASEHAPYTHTPETRLVTHTHTHNTPTHTHTHSHATTPAYTPQAHKDKRPHTHSQLHTMVRTHTVNIYTSPCKQSIPHFDLNRNLN